MIAAPMARAKIAVCEVRDLGESRHQGPRGWPRAWTGRDDRCVQQARPTPGWSGRGHSTRSVDVSRARSALRPRSARRAPDAIVGRFVRPCGRCPDDAGSIGRSRGSGPSRASMALAAPALAHGPVPVEPPTAASLLLGWTFEPLPTLGLVAVTVWWLWAVRRVNAVHPANPVPRRRTVAFLAGIAGPRLRAPVRDRPLRHRAVLDPHGPARAADAGRGAAAGAGRADHPRPAAELVGDPPPLDPAGPPFAGRAVPRPPGHGLGHVRGDDVGGPLLAAVQRVARGPGDPRPRARRCS